MSTNLDEKDRRLLALMQRDASLSVAHLAEAIHVSKSACWRRIQRLEEEGVITSRVTLLDAKRVGLPVTVYISVRTNKHNDKWAAQFKKVIAEIDEVIEVHRMSGALDYLIKAVVNDMPDYDRLYKQLIKADLFDVSSSFVLEEMKHTTVLPVDRSFD